MAATLIYITAGSRDEARTVGRALVEARLAACANILGPITSAYWWDGAVQEDDEVSLIVKTQDHLIDAVVAKVKQVHSYDCPCIVALPITGGNPDFLDWIAKETT
jgi:periplasmic divalent cation tolerance protein